MIIHFGTQIDNETWLDVDRQLFIKKVIVNSEEYQICKWLYYFMPKDMPLVPIIHIIETQTYGFVITQHYKFYDFPVLYAVQQVHSALIWLHAHHIDHFNVSKKTIFYENGKFYLGVIKIYAILKVNIVKIMNIVVWPIIFID